MNKFSKPQTVRGFIKHALPFIRGRVLDVGGGRAKYRELTEAVADSHICLDMFEGKGVDIVGDASKMPLENESFDTIICNSVLEHVKNPEQVVLECHRVLKRGGYCVISAPFLTPIHSDPSDYFRYTPEGLKELFLKQNFFVEEYGSMGSIWTVLSAFIKFTFFNPYQKSTRLSRGTFRRIENMFLFLDRHSNAGRIYSQSFIIAKKI